MSEGDSDDVPVDSDEEYEYADDNDEDYHYEEEYHDSQDGENEITTSSVTKELKNIVPTSLIRENSSGDYFLQIPYKTYIIHPGEEQFILPLLQVIMAEVSHACCTSIDEALALLRVMACNKECRIERNMDQTENFCGEATIDKYDNDLISAQFSFLSDQPDTVSDMSDNASPLCDIM
jgi:hypothetical protein